MIRPKPILIMFSLAVIATIIALILIHRRYPSLAVQPIIINHSAVPSPTSSNATSSIFNLKSSLLLAVPFTPQAPTGNWDKIHNEDCEEASSIMANAYYNGPHDVKLDAGYVEQQLTKLTDWELQNFGYNLDITSEETVKMIQANYNLQAKVVYNYSADDIKKELGQNHLVFVPENGQLLGNPNFRQPGPIYHMLVIRGYAPDFIITNDPGTRNGLNYSYTFDTLYSANGDYNHATNKVDLSKKNIIVVWKQ